MISDSLEMSEAFFAQFSETLEKSINESDLCFSKSSISAKRAELAFGLEQNLQKAEDVLGYIFDDGFDPEAEIAETISILHELSGEKGDPVTLYAMALLAMNQFGVSLENKDLVFPVLMAAVLGEVENDLPYHNNFHFRKVMLHLIRLIRKHNEIYEGRKNALDAGRICRLLAAASIHDLGHDGKNNYSEDGKYEFARNEIESFDYAAPVLKACGASGDFLSDIRVMLIITDILPFGDLISPANQMAAVFDHHFGMSEEELPALSPDLAVLEERPDLTMLCMLLHGADLMNSMGLNYEVTKAESMAINKESGKNKTTPEDIWLFLNKICQNTLMSEAVQALAEKQLRLIYEQVHDEVSASVRSG